MALDRREKTGLGCIVDCSLTDGCTYFSQFMMEARKSDTNQKKAKPVFMNIKNDLYCYTANTVLTNSQIL